MGKIPAQNKFFFKRIAPISVHCCISNRNQLLNLQCKKMTGFYMIFNTTQNRQPKFYLIHLLFLLVTQSPVGIYLLKATNNDIRVQHPLMLLLFLIVDSEKIFVEILVRFPFVCPVCINKFHNCCQIS